jgi:hypothetical protein
MVVFKPEDEKDHPSHERFARLGCDPDAITAELAHAGATLGNARLHAT